MSMQQHAHLSSRAIDPPSNALCAPSIVTSEHERAALPMQDSLALTSPPLTFPNPPLQLLPEASVSDDRAEDGWIVTAVEDGDPAALVSYSALDASARQ
ncbi:hypothetical protein HWV62_30290 [Athelia sp. TMB]|nr:hypothetical protein HWV62_30290 [Athelia sp. TMB]